MSAPLTDDPVSFIELGGVAKATVGMQVCEACQPQTSVREGESDAV